MTYTGIRFKFSEVARALTDMAKLSAPLLDRGSSGILETAAEELSRFQASDKTSLVWEIPQSNPLKTVVSEGKYRPSGNGGSAVQGSLSFVWEITKQRKKGVDTFLLDGNASTAISVCSIAESGSNCNFQWTFDVGALGSPGCHFHSFVAVPGAADLDIPRLPTPFVLPSDAVDYLLGELFQNEWEAVQTAKRMNVLRVAAGQKKRLEAFLKASLEQVGTGQNLTPWMSHKYWKPAETMFE